MKAARAAQSVRLHKQAKASFMRDKANAKKAGSTAYIWRTAKDGDVCPTCAANEGQKFAWDAKQIHGHPGEVACENSGYCRCYPEALLPRR